MRRLLAPTILVGLVAWQGWMTLTLFGPDNHWQNLTSEEPITSGRHCLHLYHGYLGASMLRDRGSVTGYDPAFQAGYPKTPVFDSGSRPAEAFIYLVNGRFQPSAYKVGFAACCVMAPLILYLAAWAAGLGETASCLATILSLLIWWGAPGRQLLEKGDLDVLLAGMAGLLHAGFLIRFHRWAGPYSWLGILISTWLGWFAEPMIFLSVLPLLLIYYLSVGCKHRLPWHTSLFAALAGGVALNGFWLLDWFSSWWLRTPLAPDHPLLTHHTFHTFWTVSVWGAQADRWFAVCLLALAVPGICIMNESRQRPAARVFGAGSVLLLGMAMAATGWDALASLGARRLWVPGLYFLAVPAAYGCITIIRYSGSWLDRWWQRGVLWTALAAVAGLSCWQGLETFALRCLGSEPLQIGLAQADCECVATLSGETTPQARILWEDDPDAVNCWTPLLPLLTDRAFLGGLDATATIDHMYATLTSRMLAGRPLSSLSDAEIAEFCKRYNVGWVVCRSSRTFARFSEFKEATLVRRYTAQGGYALFKLPWRSYALEGKAKLSEASFRRIALAEVVPENGRVVLSMHYHTGLRVTPNRAQIEKEPDPSDPIPLIRLRLSGPVARLTLTWQGR
jgi:hypothetical protein